MATETSFSATVEDEAALSHLSSQLVARGFLSRPLDLINLFVNTQEPSTSSSKSSGASQKSIHRSKLYAQALAREQIVRCLWAMLSAHNESADSFEKLSMQGRVMEYDLQRMHTMLEKEKSDKQQAHKEAETERAKTVAAKKELQAEKERHRHAKEELVKTRSTLQFIKTQALHDQKRREAELATTMARFQRLTADPAQTKFIVLNSSSNMAATSVQSVAHAAPSTTISKGSSMNRSAGRSIRPIKENATGIDKSVLPRYNVF